MVEQEGSKTEVSQETSVNLSISELEALVSKMVEDKLSQLLVIDKIDKTDISQDGEFVTSIVRDILGGYIDIRHRRGSSHEGALARKITAWQLCRRMEYTHETIAEFLNLERSTVSEHIKEIQYARNENTARGKQLRAIDASLNIELRKLKANE